MTSTVRNNYTKGSINLEPFFNSICMKFCHKIYQLGFLDGRFTASGKLTKEQAMKFILLAEELNVAIPAKIQTYIQTTYPELIEEK